MSVVLLGFVASIQRQPVKCCKKCWSCYPVACVMRPPPIYFRMFTRRSPLERVLLCGTSVINAFLRGNPSQITVTPAEAVQVLREASPACQRCLDQLGSRVFPVTPKQAAASGGIPASGAESSLPLHARSVAFLTVILLEVTQLNTSAGRDCPFGRCRPD